MTSAFPTLFRLNSRQIDSYANMVGRREQGCCEVGYPAPQCDAPDASKITSRVDDMAKPGLTCTKLSAMDPVQAGNACGRDANHRDSCSRCYKAAMPVAGARSMLLRC